MAFLEELKSNYKERLALLRKAEMNEKDVDKKKLYGKLIEEYEYKCKLMSNIDLEKVKELL